MSLSILQDPQLDPQQLREQAAALVARAEAMETEQRAEYQARTIARAVENDAQRQGHKAHIGILPDGTPVWVGAAAYEREHYDTTTYAEASYDKYRLPFDHQDAPQQAAGIRNAISEHGRGELDPAALSWLGNYERNKPKFVPARHMWPDPQPLSLKLDPATGHLHFTTPEGETWPLAPFAAFAACGAPPSGEGELTVSFRNCNARDCSKGNIAWQRGGLLWRGAGPIGSAVMQRTRRVASGARNGNARLTEAPVGDIKALLGTKSNVALATDFGVSEPTIRRIKRGEGWR